MDNRGKYLFQEKLTNIIHDVTEDQLNKLREEYLKEVRENHKVTNMSYAGENYYGRYDFPVAVNRECLYRDQKTDGMRIQYPHGVVLQQAKFRNYYRGEPQIYTKSQPTLLRKLEAYTDKEDKELYRMVANMRIAEFSALLRKFEHVRQWDVSDIQYEALAQHYGLETDWLDITTDFDVAMFFATCWWDKEEKRWKPLTKDQTESSEETKYGMIFHMPSWYMSQRWCFEIEKFADISKGVPDNLIYPIGFQPFMRCSMQNGYGIYMQESKPLQKDIGFEKLRFRHDEKFSIQIFERMKGGELIYPHEGLNEVEFLIDQIKSLTDFSEESFLYALQRSHMFRLKDKELCRQKLEAFYVDRKKITIKPSNVWHISRDRRRMIDDDYSGFDVEKFYNIHIRGRKLCGPEGETVGANMYEPYMLSNNDSTENPGILDFNPRNMTGEMNMWMLRRMQLLQTLVTKNARDF